MSAPALFSRRGSGRSLLALGLALAAVWLNSPAAWAAGSANLWPNGASGNRANSEWRTDSYGGGAITRRTILHAYAQAGEFIFMGSTARGVVNGATVGDILAYNPGQVTGPIGTEIVPLPASAAFSCNAQATGLGAPANQGQILNRAAELAGPDTIPVGGVAGGYTPCYYQAPSAGVYSIVMTGPSGFTVAGNGTVAHDVALTAAGDFSSAQGTSVAGWDVTVRSSLVSVTNIQGRVFAYYLALFTGGNGLPVFPVVYASTNDGYRYSIDLRGMDPNGWVTYGNQVGFLDSDGTTPLYHDAVAANLGAPGQLTNIQGGVQFAVPTFPLFFEPPADTTLTALGIPTVPVAPVITTVSFAGNVSGNTTTINSGGTFSYNSNVSGIYDIVISADGVNFDPTLPANRRLRGVRPSGAQTVSWDGSDNSGTAFPVGSYTYRASVHGGEYHFPFIDVENSTLGGPTVTLLNPVGGICPPWTGLCKGGFYDDRAYRTLGGTVVDSGNTVGSTLCGLNPPVTNHSDPLLGFDTASGQRAFGANPGSNTNAPCTGSFGDAKGLDLWTYTPSAALSNNVNIVAPTADLALSKTVSNPTPSLGSNVTFTITATNNGPSPATGVAVTDLLPSGLSLVSSTVSAGAYNAGTGVWTIGPMANGSTATLQIVATVTSTSLVTNTAAKSAENESDPNLANDSASVSVTGQSADIAITKVVDNPAPNVGSDVTFTVVATNNGPSNATGVAVTDLLPPGLTLISATPSVGSYDALTGIWTIGNLADLAGATLQIVATATSTATVTNTATKSAENQPDPNAGNNSASASVTGQSADIAVTKAVDRTTPNVGSNVTFTITATNNGPSNATGVFATDVLPAGLTLVSATPSMGSFSPLTGLWAIGSLANGATATLQVVATVSSAGLITNTASRLSGGQPDPNAGNDTASASVNGQSADIAISKVVNNPTPNLGTNVTFTVVATNNGPSAATGVTVTDLLPPGLTLASSAPSVGAYNAGTGTWTIGSLANAATATLSIVATVTSTGLVTNTAAKSAEDQSDPNVGNDTASASVTGQSADVVITKVVDNPTPNLGSNVTFTVVANNAGPGSATGVAVTDVLPAGLAFVSATPSSGTYDPSTGVWTIGNLANGSSATLAVVATVRSTSPVTNLATKSAQDQPDPVIGNNSASAIVTGQAADIAVTQVVSSATPAVGTRVTFTISAANLGPNNATSIVVADLLPTGLSFVSATPSQGSFNPATGVWTVGSLANGASATLQLVATVTTTSTITNVATRTASSPVDPNPFNDIASVRLTASTVPGLPADGVPPISGWLGLPLFLLGLGAAIFSRRRLRARRTS